jgi:hypothetical protein
MVERIVDPTSIDFDIVHREIANPTGLLAEVMRRSLEPLRETLRAIVRELLGKGTSQRTVRLCEMSVRAQCFGLMRERRQHTVAAGLPRLAPPLTEMGVDALVEHIFVFSLAGIRDAKGRADRVGKRRGKGK